MCGRFVSSRRPEDLASLFGARWDGEPVPPSWNVAPTDAVYTVLERLAKDGTGADRQVRALRWGLVPSWSKDPGAGARMINARVETVDSKPAFRKAFTSRRCLLPADGYFEWIPVQDPGGKPRKQPYYLTPSSGELMAMAGLYEFWRDQNLPKEDPAAWLSTCTIITTDAKDAAGRVHDRMPLTIAPDAWDDWLDPAHQDTDSLRALLAVPAGGELEVREVSSAVNNVRNNGAQLVAPLA